MSTATSWVAVAISFASLALSVRTDRRTRVELHRRVAIGPVDDELRDVVIQTRTLFQDVVTNGGCESSWGGFDGRTSPSQQLHDHAPRVGDTALKESVENAARAWDATVAFAQPPRAPRVYNPNLPYPEDWAREDARYETLFAQQVAVARNGIEECNAALDRLNELERVGPRGEVLGLRGVQGGAFGSATSGLRSRCR